MSEDAVSAMSDVVIKILVDLRWENFIEFKRHLQQEVLEGFPAIPKSQLEKAGAWFIKCALMRHFGRNMMKVTKRVLECMRQYELVEKLSKLDRRELRGKKKAGREEEFANQ